MSSQAKNDRDDFLAHAARLLRDEVPTPGDSTWARIAGDVRRARRRRRWISAVVLQLGIGLAGMGVWGVASGRLSALVRAPAPSSPPAVNAPGKAPLRRRAAPAPEPSLAPSEEPAPTAPAPAPVRRVESSGTAKRPAARAAGETPSLAPRAAVGDALYLEAHRLHFVRRDFAAAIEAWDRYLAEGAGPLAIEGRYNRAIALAHLGRRAEAAAALRPFAEGPSGAYRREEARALIDRLGN